MAKKSAKFEPIRFRESPTTHGKMDIPFVVGNKTFSHRSLVTDTEEDLILGMEVMNIRGFELNIRYDTLKINEEEVVLHGKEEQVCRVILTGDVSIPNAVK